MAIKGAVLGDILGSQYEFNRPKNLDWQNIPLIIDDKAKFTDDSVMMLAIKKALVEDNDLVETMVDVGQQYPFCGYGAKFFSWINGKKHQPYNSWGNGSAMRVAFVGDFYEDYDEMQAMAAKTAEVSHNHPEGIKGAVVTATCIWMAKRGKSKQEIYDYVLSELRSGNHSDAGFSCGFGMEGGCDPEVHHNTGICELYSFACRRSYLFAYHNE